MDFAELLGRTGSVDSLGRIAVTCSTTTKDIEHLVAITSNYFGRALMERTKARGGNARLRQLIESGGPQQFIDRPALLDSDVARIEGRSLLTFLFSNSVQVGKFEACVGQKSGLAGKKIRRALPILACLYLGAVCVCLSPRRG